MKKIVVTGGNGFIGSNLINFLSKKKYFVINIDKNKYSKGSYLLKNLSKKYYKFYKLDINSKKIFHILKKYKPVIAKFDFEFFGFSLIVVILLLTFKLAIPNSSGLLTG